MLSGGDRFRRWFGEEVFGFSELRGGSLVSARPAAGLPGQGVQASASLRQDFYVEISGAPVRIQQTQDCRPRKSQSSLRDSI